MFTKRCLSVVMVALLVQPPLLVCGNDLDQKDSEKVVVAEQSDEVLQGGTESPEAVDARSTTINLPGGISIITDDRRVQGAIGFVLILLACKYLGLIGNTSPSTS